MTSEPLTVPTTPFEFQPRPPAFTIPRLVGAVMFAHLCAALGLPLMGAVVMLPFQSLLISLSAANPALSSAINPGVFNTILVGMIFMLTGVVLALVEVWMAGRWIRRGRAFLAASALATLVLVSALGFLITNLPFWFGVIYTPGLLERGMLLPAMIATFTLLGLLAGLALGAVQARWLTISRRAWVLVTGLVWAVSVGLTYTVWAFWLINLD